MANVTVYVDGVAFECMSTTHNWYMHDQWRHLTTATIDTNHIEWVDILHWHWMRDMIYCCKYMMVHTLLVCLIILHQLTSIRSLDISHVDIYHCKYILMIVVLIQPTPTCQPCKSCWMHMITHKTTWLSMTMSSKYYPIVSIYIAYSWTRSVFVYTCCSCMHCTCRFVDLCICLMQLLILIRTTIDDRCFRLWLWCMLYHQMTCYVIILHTLH